MTSWKLIWISCDTFRIHIDLVLIICKITLNYVTGFSYLLICSGKVKLSLNLFQGCDPLALLQSAEDGASMYTHHLCVEDFYDCLESVVTTRFHEDLAHAPYGMFAIEADEAIDSANESVIITYIRYF